MDIRVHNGTGLDAEEVVRFLERCNQTHNGNYVVASQLGSLLSLESIVVEARQKANIVGVICCFPIRTNVGTYACITFFCVDPIHRKKGLASQLKARMVKECHDRHISFSYQITNKPMFETSIALGSWYRPLNTEIANRAMFELPYGRYPKNKDNTIMAIRALGTDYRYIQLLDRCSFRWCPTYPQYLSWLTACPTYVVKDRTGVVRGMFSLYNLRMVVNSVLLNMDHLTWFVGDPEKVLTSAIEISMADMVIGHLVGGLTMDMLKTNKAHLSNGAFLSLYGVKKNVKAEEISLPLL